jgi:hypothetical protein
VCFLLIYMGSFTPLAREVSGQQNAATDPAYVGLLAAARRLATSQAIEKAIQPDATLTQKRAALDERPVQEALDALKKWLDSAGGPMAELRLDNNLVLTEAGNIRLLGRALAIQQYVALAGGRVGDAIDVTRDALRLGYFLQAHSLMSALIGYAIEITTIQQLGRHLDQLSLRDCSRLASLAQEWTRSPSALAIALEREQQAGIAQLRMQLATQNNAQEVARQEAALNRAYAQIQKRLQTPYWQLQEAKGDTAPDSNDAGSALAQTLLPIFTKAQDAYVRRVAFARMLGCHAAIRRFRWENEKWPASLAELKLGEMARDPFTGQEFVYKATRNKYTLESAGPLPAEKGAARAPLSLTPNTEP